MATTIDDLGARWNAGDLAEVEAAVMRRLEHIEAAMEAEASKREAVCGAIDDLLREMSQMCGYLASVADRLRANS